MMTYSFPEADNKYDALGTPTRNSISIIYYISLINVIVSRPTKVFLGYAQCYLVNIHMQRHTIFGYLTTPPPLLSRFVTILSPPPKDDIASFLFLIKFSQ